MCAWEDRSIFWFAIKNYNITLNYALKNAILIIINTIELIY